LLMGVLEVTSRARALHVACLSAQKPSKHSTVAPGVVQRHPVVAVVVDEAAAACRAFCRAMEPSTPVPVDEPGEQLAGQLLMLVVHSPESHRIGTDAGQLSSALVPVRLGLGLAIVPAAPHFSAEAAQEWSAQRTLGARHAGVGGHRPAALTHEPS